MVALRRASLRVLNLTPKPIEGASLALQSVDNIHGSDCLSLGVLGVGDGITDHVLQKYLENTASLFVDETGDTLHTTTTSQTTDCGFGDSLDVVTEDFSVALGTSFSETFASLSTARHDELLELLRLELNRNDDIVTLPRQLYTAKFLLPDLFVKTCFQQSRMRIRI